MICTKILFLLEFCFNSNDFFYLRNQHRLILVVGQHVDVGTVRNGENVGWNFITPLTTVQFGATVCVYGVTFVRIDSDTEKSGVGLDIRRK